MAAEDWVLSNGKMLYDSRVKNQNTATSLYGSGSKHFANGTSYTAGDTGRNITLGNNGYYTANGKSEAVQDQALLAMYDNKSITGISTLNPKDDALYAGQARPALGNTLIGVGEISQVTGDAATVAGLGMSVTGFGAAVGGPLTVFGGITSKFGLAAEVSGDFIKNGVNDKTISKNLTKVGLSLLFEGLGNAGVRASEKVATDQAGNIINNKTTEAVIQATSFGADKTAGVFHEKIYK